MNILLNSMTGVLVNVMQPCTMDCCCLFYKHIATGIKMYYNCETFSIETVAI